MKKSYVTVTDQFCGAGGSSIGAIGAGAELRMAINHWRLSLSIRTAQTFQAQTMIVSTFRRAIKAHLRRIS